MNEARPRGIALLEAVDSDEVEVIDAFLVKSAAGRSPKGGAKDELAQASRRRAPVMCRSRARSPRPASILPGD